MRSSWEVSFSKWLDSNNYVWQYEEKTFNLGSLGSYTPDFYVEALDIYFEVKGWLRDDAKSKIEKFKEIFSDKKLIIADKQYLKSIGCDLSKSYSANRPKIQCPWCNIMFAPKEKRQKYCSLSCSNKSNGKKKMGIKYHRK